MNEIQSLNDCAISVLVWENVQSTFGTGVQFTYILSRIKRC